MSDVIPLGNTLPSDVFDGEPYCVIYDPHRTILCPENDLLPFDSIAHVCYDEAQWTAELDGALHKRLILLLIFTDETELEIKAFITAHELDQPRLHSLFLIFRNGLRCHDKWSGTSLSALSWCRSVTRQLLSDVREVCMTTCVLRASFYEQRRRQAEDSMANDGHSARSIARLLARLRKGCSRQLEEYWANS